MFRMKRDSFEKLYNTLEPLLYAPNEAMAQRSSGSTVSKKTKLYCTLRWLAGGSNLDICLAYGVSWSSFFSTSYKSGIVWPVIDAVNIAFQIGIPRSRDKLRQIANSFTRFTSGKLHFQNHLAPLPGLSTASAQNKIDFNTLSCKVNIFTHLLKKHPGLPGPKKWSQIAVHKVG